MVATVFCQAANRSRTASGASLDRLHYLGERGRPEVACGCRQLRRQLLDVCLEHLVGGSLLLIAALDLSNLDLELGRHVLRVQRFQQLRDTVKLLCLASQVDIRPALCRLGQQYIRPRVGRSLRYLGLGKILDQRIERLLRLGIPAGVHQESNDRARAQRRFVARPAPTGW